MFLYHGSNITIEEPRLVPARRKLDFGAGFYLTSDLEQARKWAIRTKTMREEGVPSISVFECDISELEQLRVLSFKSPNRKWLRFVVANRTGKATRQYDIVSGPVANDQTIRVVNDFINGYLTEDIAIRLLLPQKLKDQYAFKTEDALKCLHFKEVIL